MKKFTENLLASFLAPKSKNEDKKRKEHIFNVLISSSLVLFFFSIIVNIFVSFYRPESYEQSGISIFFLLGMFAFLLFLYFLSRKGFFQLSAIIFISMFFFIAMTISTEWGVDVNASILIYALCIIMASILINTKFAFLLTAVIGISMITISSLQELQLLQVNNYWREEPWTHTDTFMTIIIFFLISIVSWLSNRETEKSLKRARNSEALLMKERDELEIKIIERTKELREAESEKIAQLYRFAEFGRLSSGLFHDLMNPLSALSLNIEKIQEKKENHSEAKEYISSAIRVARKMESLVIAIRKQISKEKESKSFSLNESIKEIIEVLTYKSYLHNVEIIFNSLDELAVYGEEMKWNQVVLNLITNSIDAYDDIKKSDERERKIIIKLTKKENEIHFSVEDFGVGIKEENIEKVFEPFFSTKTENDVKGTGLGLSMTKDIIEKNFKGKISVKSKYDVGTTFLIVIPLEQNMPS